ncbi:hypothetical protein SSX86_010039 [Deinandra increscens subsp. villosa]|uniref:F-box domain-containing protein n=1 Tax=Deinandra increscens subsp. villosa TaxID=3103831 RepID=A0AAP0DAA3_9ASTR
MDRISQLPDFIVHHILSSFFTPFEAPPVEPIRMSVLSKKWFDLTASFPVLDFECCSFVEKFQSRQSFFKYVEYTTSRFCLQNVPAHTFRLCTGLRFPAELDIAKRCVDLVLTKGVKELVIDFIISVNGQTYRFPDILLSVSVLKSLTICRCELPSSLMVNGLKFKSLNKLILVDVPLDDEVIKYLTTHCPLLQILHVLNCHGLKRFCVYGLQNLEEVWISYNTPFELIDVEAPNLSTLVVRDTFGRGVTRMNLASCKKLTTVTYYGRFLPNDLLSNFPFIENFRFVTESTCKNIKLSCHSLRTLVLNSDCDLDEVELNTLNLDLFVYGSVWPMTIDKRWPLSRDSSSTRLKACMQCYHNGIVVEALWFHKLRLFLDKKCGFKVLNLCVDMTPSVVFTELEKLKAIELQPYELEHVEMTLGTMHEGASVHVAFVEAVLWCCRPQSLTLISSLPFDFDVQSNLVKFTYEKLLEQEDEGHTNIQIMSPSSSSLMASSPNGEAITFIKKEVEKKHRATHTNLLTHIISNHKGGFHFSILRSVIRKMPMETGDKDRISELPESIVHHILSFLNNLNAPPVELVRMSVLSKTWFNLTASFPILYFSTDDFKSGESFFKYVEYTTSRFFHQNITAQKLSFKVTLREPAEVDTVNKCLELVLQNGVRKLEILVIISSESPMPTYRLPNILLSVSVLESLTIVGCELPSSLMVDIVNFTSLTHLTLVHIRIDDEMIKHLTTGCPLLQIDVEATNLSILSLTDLYGRGTPRMNVASCKKLTMVFYRGLSLPNSNGLSDFISMFPFVENLYLSTTYICNILKLSSQSLRILVVRLICDLEKIELNTPNLVAFNYSVSHTDRLTRHHKCCSLLRGSTQLKGFMHYFAYGNIMDAPWFHKLRLFLAKNSGFKVLNLCINLTETDPNTFHSSEIVKELEKLKAIEFPPYELENVELQLHEESLANVALVDAVLWCCRPRSLIVSYPFSDFDAQSAFVKFTSEKLLLQEDEGRTKIQIVSPSSSFLMASSRNRKAITFIKEEGTEQDNETVKSMSDALDLGVYQFGRMENNIEVFVIGDDGLQKDGARHCVLDT